MTKHSGNLIKQTTINNSSKSREASSNGMAKVQRNILIVCVFSKLVYLSKNNNLSTLEPQLPIEREPD